MRIHAACRGPRGRRGQVLILIVGALFLGGGAGLVAGSMLAGRTLSQVSVGVSANVADGSRRAAAKQVLDAWEHDTNRDLEHFRERFEALDGLMRAHGTTRAQVEAELAGLDRDTDAGVRSALARREELRAILTDAEWRIVFAP